MEGRREKCEGRTRRPHEDRDISALVLRPSAFALQSLLTSTPTIAFILSFSETFQVPLDLQRAGSPPNLFKQMKRREFLKSSLTVSTMVGLSRAGLGASAAESTAPNREYYELRIYRLKPGAKGDLLDAY